MRVCVPSLPSALPSTPNGGAPATTAFGPARLSSSHTGLAPFPEQQALV